MTDPQTSNLIPASLMRIRCFMNRRGMKVKPWLGPEAVLAAFYATLRSQQPSDAFWGELTQLLAELSRDMRRRVSSRGWVIENELLDQACHERLLAEIRAALGDSAGPKQLGAFAGKLPARAGALLLMLAAAIVVGCDDQDFESRSLGEIEGATSSLKGGAASASGSTQPVGTGGTLNSTTLEPAGTGGGAASTSGGAAAEYPCPSPGKTSGLDPTEFAACNQKLVEALIPYDLSDGNGKQLLQCACLLNDAWQTGLAELFGGKNCGDIAAYFDQCGVRDFCSKQASGHLPANFDAEQFVNCSVVTLYLGVRCD